MLRYGSSSSRITAPVYGSTTSRIIQLPEHGTPDVFSEPQRLSLLPTTETPLGLYMSSCEFEALLSRYPHPLNLADDVKKGNTKVECRSYRRHRIFARFHTT